DSAFEVDGDLDITGNYKVDGSNLATTHVIEGTNLYWTQARFNSALAAKDSDDLLEGTTNLYYTNGRFTTDYNAAIATTSTDALQEGTINLFWSDSRFNTPFDNRLTAQFDTR